MLVFPKNHKESRHQREYWWNGKLQDEDHDCTGDKDKGNASWCSNVSLLLPPFSDWACVKRFPPLPWPWYGAAAQAAKSHPVPHRSFAVTTSSAFATSHSSVFHTVQNSGAEAHAAQHITEMPVAVLGHDTVQSNFGDHSNSCVTLQAAPWLSHKPCPHANYFTSAFGSHAASQVSSVLIWVALQHHLKSYLHILSVPPPSNTWAPHNFEFLNLFSHDSFEMRVQFSAFYRQDANCSFSEIPLSPALKGSHLSDSTQSWTKAFHSPDRQRHSPTQSLSCA